MRSTKIGSFRFPLFVCALSALIAFLLLFVMPRAASQASLSYGEVASEESKNTIDFVRVGIKYSTDVVSDYHFTVSNGINFGIQNEETHNFLTLGQALGQSFNVVREAGNYYVDITAEQDSTVITQLKELAEGKSCHIFPRYSGNGVFTSLRIGSFESEQTATALLNDIQALFVDIPAQISTGGNDDVLLINENGVPLVAYCQSDEGNAFAVNPIQNTPQAEQTDNNEAFGEELITTDDGYIYQGSFEFRIYRYSTVDGISVINILPIEKYVAGVMSYEISNSYTLEIQKTFAIVVRNYTYSSYSKHKSMHFSTCCSTHCQAYRGCDRVNDTVRQASAETEGLIISYGGKYAKTYYSASAGGCTIAVHETWQSSQYPYLKAVPTPWETYLSRKVSNWTVEFTPNELYLRVKGTCQKLQGDIASVSTTYATDSPHIYSVTLTDIYGNSDTVTMSTQVRYLFGFNSGNFVVGKAGETVKQRVYSLDNFESIYSPDFKGIILPPDLNGKLYVQTETGVVSISPDRAYTYVTPKGDRTLGFSEDQIVIIGSDSENNITQGGLPDILNGKPVMKEYDVTLEGKDGNFVFKGLGWGHGAGLSQYGLIDLVNLGYDCKTILQYYFNGTEVVGANSLG